MTLAPSQSPKNRRRRRILLAAAILFAIAILPIAAFHAAVEFVPYPTNADQPIAPATWITDRTGTPLAAFVSPSGQWCLPLTSDQISPHLLDAIVATEDCRFYQHGGVDWQSVLGAAGHDLAARSARRGASTITMQLFRLRQPATRSWSAKLMQAIHACQIEKKLSKPQILTEYLNRAPFGGNLVGAGAASWRYFGRPCRDLSLGQAALLAGIPQNPNGLRPDRFPARAKVRRDHVLDRMLACGMITAAQRDLAAAEPIDASWHPLPQDPPSPAASRGLLPMLTDLAARAPGQSVATAIDPTTQKIAEDLANKTLARLAPSHIDSVAVVVLDTATGQCLADVSLTTSAIGGRMLDLTARPRSTGSTLKPFIYAAAFDAGICTPSTILSDAPASWSGYEPADYDHDFAGPITAADALAQSRNIPALLLLSKVTIPRAVELMNAFGLHTLAHPAQPYGLPLAIGGADATPMELAQSYAALSRTALEKSGDAASFSRGKKLAASSFLVPVAISPSLGTPGEGRGGGPDFSASSHNPFRASSCLDALYCLADPDRTARICPSAARFSPAWKTGTSSGHRDAWCAAVTPGRAVVVWLGNLDGAGSDRLVGADAAAPLALNLIAAISSPTEATFTPPPGFAAAPALASAELSAAADQLILLSPTPNQEIIADPTMPADRQQLVLRARDPSDADSVIYWFIDGKIIGHSASGQPLWWPPTPGSHEVRAVSQTGQSARARIVVR